MLSQLFERKHLARDLSFIKYILSSAEICNYMEKYNKDIVKFFSTRNEIQN